MRKQNILLALILVFSLNVKAQDLEPKVWLNGYSRSVLFLDEMEIDRANDSISPSRLNSGHTLVDLTANIKPNESTYINAQMRVRNDYGGFWGAGITFDLRQLYVRGVIAKVLKYQLGDFDYKMTPFTFYNPYQEFFEDAPDYLRSFYDMTNQDFFLKDENTRRQQGAAIEFGLGFKKAIEEINFNMFISRLNASDFNQINDRLAIGGMVDLVQSDLLSLGLNYTDILDLRGTSNNDMRFHNPVYSIEGSLNHSLEKMDLSLSGEAGASQRYTLNDASSPKMEDWFYNFQGAIEMPKSDLKVNLDYREVGPDFRSPGAQTIRNNYMAIPAAFARLGNDQMLRPTNTLDFMRDASLVNGLIELQLQAFNPFYNNIEPFGEATPNRKGLTLNIEKGDEKDKYLVKAHLKSLSEVVGQGTSALRSFMQVGGKAQLNAHNLIENYNKKLELQLFVTNTSTSRSGDQEFESVDLKQNLIDGSVKVGVHKKINLLFGYRSIKTEGNEQYAVRDANTQVINFTEMQSDLDEQLITYGLECPFSEKVNLSLLRQHYSWSDPQTNTADFKMNNWSVIFTMKF